MFKRRSFLTGLAFVSGLAASQANQLIANATHPSRQKISSTSLDSNLPVAAKYRKSIPSWLDRVSLSNSQAEQIIQINQRFKQPLADRKVAVKQAAAKLRHLDQPLNSPTVVKQKKALIQATQQFERELDQKRLAIRNVVTPEQRLVAATAIANRRKSDHLLSIWMPNAKVAIVQ